jgi:hypothetical protein
VCVCSTKTNDGQEQWRRIRHEDCSGLEVGAPCLQWPVYAIQYVGCDSKRPIRVVSVEILDFRGCSLISTGWLGRQSVSSLQDGGKKIKLVESARGRNFTNYLIQLMLNTASQVVDGCKRVCRAEETTQNREPTGHWALSKSASRSTITYSPHVCRLTGQKLVNVVWLESDELTMKAIALNLCENLGPSGSIVNNMESVTQTEAQNATLMPAGILRPKRALAIREAQFYVWTRGSGHHAGHRLTQTNRLPHISYFIKLRTQLVNMKSQCNF